MPFPNTLSVVLGERRRTRLYPLIKLRTKQGPCCAAFVGGGRHVRITAATGEPKTDVELVTREWDYDVEQFMRKVA